MNVATTEIYATVSIARKREILERAARADVLPAGPQDELPESHRAPGQAEGAADKPFAYLFFDVVDRRYENDCPSTMILTSNTPTNNWDEFFTGDDTLLCTLNRLFDRASVFVMKGASFRGAELEIFSVEASPTAMKANK